MYLLPLYGRTFCCNAFVQEVLEGICSTKTCSEFFTLLVLILQVSTFRCKFQGKLVVKDAFVGAMRCLVEIFEDFMNMVRFVMNNVNWRCVDRSGTDTQKSCETHTSCNWRRVVSRGVDRKNQVETWSDRCPKNMLVSVLLNLN